MKWVFYTTLACMILVSPLVRLHREVGPFGGSVGCTVLVLDNQARRKRLPLDRNHTKSSPKSTPLSPL